MEHSMQLQAVPRLAAMVLLIVLLAAALVAIAAIGSTPRLPNPFGPAANGSLVYDTKDDDLRLEQGRKRCAATHRRGRPRVQSHMVPETGPTSRSGATRARTRCSSPTRMAATSERLTSRHLDLHRQTADLVTRRSVHSLFRGKWARPARRAALRRRDRDRRCHAGRPRWTERRSVVLPVVVARRRWIAFVGVPHAAGGRHGAVGRPAQRPRTTQAPDQPSCRVVPTAMGTKRRSAASRVRRPASDQIGPRCLHPRCRDRRRDRRSRRSRT